MSPLSRQLQLREPRASSWWQDMQSPIGAATTALRRLTQDCLMLTNEHRAKTGAASRRAMTVAARVANPSQAR